MTTCRYCGTQLTDLYIDPACSRCLDPRQCLGCFLYDLIMLAAYGRDEIVGALDQCNVCAHELMEGP